MSEFRLVVDEWSLEDPDTLQPHPRAVRRGDLSVIRESIEATGFASALVCWRADGNRLILAGRHRWDVARQLGMDRVPVLWLDVDAATATRIVLVDNRSSDLAANDLEALERALSLLEDSAGLDGSGYDDRALAALRGLLSQDEDEDEDEDEDPGPEREVLRLVVSPDAYDRFWRLMEDTEGAPHGSHADRLRELLDSLP